MRQLSVTLLAVLAMGAALTSTVLLTHNSRPAVAAGTPIEISAGSSHSCAVMDTGSLHCWGANHEGQLGDGGVCGSACTTPVLIPDAITVSAVDAGFFHTCAVTTAGAAKCWGRNRDGQLGDGTTAERTSPVDVAGLSSNIEAISAGSAHSCALRSGGAVECWGSNVAGQLGDARACGQRCTVPADVPGLDDITALTTGESHTCALDASGAVTCWGNNLHGQLGDGTTAERTAPVAVSGLSNVIAISAGQMHTCALLSGGSVECWGDNLYGQLGDGTTISRSVPAPVVGLDGKVSAVSAGRYHTCALLEAGYVECWGPQLYGPFSEGAFTVRTKPYHASALGTDVVAISAGGFHTCSLLGSGKVRCWGYNGYGQVGIGGTTSRIVSGDVIGIGGDGPKPTLTLTATLTSTESPTPASTATATQTTSATATNTPADTPDPTATDTPPNTDTPAPATTDTPTATPLPRLLGDANGNGVINAIDAALTLQYAAGLEITVYASADVNQDGRIDSVDAALILQAVAGLIGLS